MTWVRERESESPAVITYQELYKRVNEVAAMLRDFAGLKTGDRVTIHMPMIPELPITMLACARLGVVHSVVFGGFSGERSEEHTSELQSHSDIVCRLLLEKKKKKSNQLV